MTRAILASIMILLAFNPYGEQASARGLYEVEATNGTRFVLKEMVRDELGVNVLVASKSFGDDFPGTEFGPTQFQDYIFDCRGHFFIPQGHGWSYLPPRSALGVLAQYACDHATTNLTAR